MFKFLEFLRIPHCLTRMLYFKFQAVFENKTEECASCSVINEIKVLTCKIWWLRTVIEKIWKMVKCQGKIVEKSGNFEKENEWQPWRNISRMLMHF